VVWKLITTSRTKKLIFIGHQQNTLIMLMYIYIYIVVYILQNSSVSLYFCLVVHHQLGKVIQMNQLDATMIY